MRSTQTLKSCHTNYIHTPTIHHSTPPKHPTQTPHRNTPPTTQVDSTAALTTVNTLLDCLLRPSPGLTCPLASSVLLPGEVSPGQPGAGYVGILPTISVNDQDPIPGVKKPVERVVWEYMAQRVVDVHDSVQGGVGGGCV